MNMEKAFDRVPRDVVWCALQSLGMDGVGEKSNI